MGEVVAVETAPGFTPGPWESWRLPSGIFDRIDTEPNTFGAAGLCKVDTSTDEGLANLALIKAAPDLYAALRGLLQAAADVIEIHGADIWPDLAEDETPDLEMWAARAKAALAKAGLPA